MKIELIKFYYGDIPEEIAGGNELKSTKILVKFIPAF